MRQQPNDARIALAAAYKPSLLAKLADRRFRNAFLQLTRNLPAGRNAVPVFASAFNNAAREECPISPKGQDLREILQAVLTAALQTGDHATIAAVTLDVEHFLTILHEQVFAVLPNEAAAFANATVNVGSDLAAAQAAITRAGTTRDPSAIEAAARECQKAEVAIERFEDSASRILHGVA